MSNNDDTSMIAAIAAAAAISSDEGAKTFEEWESLGYPKYHSIILWYFFGWLLLWIPCIYYTFSALHGWKIGPIKFTPRKWKKYYKWRAEQEKEAQRNMAAEQEQLINAEMARHEKAKVKFDPEHDTMAHFEVEDPANNKTVDEMKRIREMGGTIREILYRSPNGTEYHFDSPEELEEFLRLQEKGN